MNYDNLQKSLRLSRLAMGGCGALLSLTACSKPAPPPEDVRPVRTLTVQAGAVALQNTYAGEVRPRYESNLGFRVTGQIQQRLVNDGDSVKRGQVLARLDPKDLNLSEAGSRANLTAQKAQLEVERADLERDRKLVAENVISQSAYDRQLSIFQAAQAQYEAGQAALRQSGNQVDYALLHADHDGSISSIAAEAGQVVAAGQTVATLAWSGATEVAVNVPEDQVRRISVNQAAQVSLWSAAGKTYEGTVREISASADPATRTYAVRVSLPQTSEEIRYGMTASVRFQISGLPNLIHVPLPALIEHDGKAGVWVLDTQAGTVGFREVVSAGVVGNEILISGGLQPGDIVVTAGAPLLHAAQKVRQLNATAVAQ
ncbi:MAG: efflux transporter periplasmic adaptor subunit [Nevskia sp.]|nr:efflux transporter periplasmic adaptor subunit [Nevskia sp.]